VGKLGELNGQDELESIEVLCNSHLTTVSLWRERMEAMACE
jgi:hypothetical protein